MKASDYIASFLSKHAVKTVFGYQGGNVAHIIDSIGARDDLQFVSTYNEQGAAFAACGYALEKRTLGVAIASSGPGAINLISGIANAYYDSIPTLFITGNVSISSMKQVDSIRQNAFQENDIVSMVSKVTKYAITVMNPHELRFHLEKAVYLAQSGRPGPVLLDIPHTIQKTELDFEKEKGALMPAKRQTDFSESIDQIKQAVSNAERPLMIVGGGTTSEKARRMVSELLEIWRLPVVSTLRGLDVVSHKSDYYAGFGGAYGNRAANHAVKYADVILALGARMDERFICTLDKSVFSRKEIFHVDIDPTELRRVFLEEYGVEGDASVFLQSLLASELPHLNFSKWIDTIQKWKERYPSAEEKWTINDSSFFLSKSVPDNSIFCLDVGINQMGVAQSIVLNEKQRCFTSAGHGAMGCSIPMAIGAAFADTQKEIYCFVGDGALHMNIQELLMLSKYRLPIHVILNNNKCLGMIRDYQTKAFNSRFVGTIDFLQEIDYREIAKAYKLDYCRASSREELHLIKDMLLSHSPCFVELSFSEETDTNPRLGADMFNQIPTLSDEEIFRMEKEALSCGNTRSW